MHIQSMRGNERYTHLRQKELIKICELPTDKQQRPCFECKRPCECSQSATCTCGCSAQCEHISETVSSSPQNYPIEAKIIPLVYSISSLAHCQPCWSCEGHTDQQGNVIKYPSVWFYSELMLLPHIINRTIQKLVLYDANVRNKWVVELVSFDANIAPAYVLKPTFESEEIVNLASLQGDVRYISEHLFNCVKSEARVQLQAMNNAA